MSPDVPAASKKKIEDISKAGHSQIIKKTDDLSTTSSNSAGLGIDSKEQSDVWSSPESSCSSSSSSADKIFEHRDELASRQKEGT